MLTAPPGGYYETQVDTAALGPARLKTLLERGSRVGGPQPARRWVWVTVDPSRAGHSPIDLAGWVFAATSGGSHKTCESGPYATTRWPRRGCPLFPVVAARPQPSRSSGFFDVLGRAMPQFESQRGVRCGVPEATTWAKVGTW